ncbi:MAG: aldehyde dehydrogenase family protein [Longimicrobiaceae bacterium]
MATELETGVKPGRLYIGGEWQDAASGRTFDTVNPATGKVLTQVAEGAAEDVDRAVRAARAAFEGGKWPAMSGRERGRILYRMAELIDQRADELARLETLDNGKPFREARGIDIKDSAECFRYYAGWADKIEGEVIPVSGAYLNYTRREPVGVCGQIIPWNYPFQMAAWKVAPALACGNTIVLKPAEQTPLTALELARIGEEAGLPPGVLNVVPGFGETAGAALVAHPDVDKIAFTGSTAVGKLIQREAAGTLKKVSLELGGKSPNIVLADADVDAAVKGATMGIFYNTGQACTAGSRLLVDERVRDELVEKLTKRAAGMTPGDPFDKATRMGPLVSQEQLDRVMGYVQTGRDEGAELVLGGDSPQVNGGGGFFMNPTIFDRVTPEMTIAREEIFGPVMSVLSWRDWDDMVARANGTKLGLTANVWTNDVNAAVRTARALEAGYVYVNGSGRRPGGMPFGGWKNSGLGQENGLEELLSYTREKVVTVTLL